MTMTQHTVKLGTLSPDDLHDLGGKKGVTVRIYAQHKGWQLHKVFDRRGAKKLLPERVLTERTKVMVAN